MVKLFYHMLKRYCINLCLFEIMQQEFPFSFKLSFINILDKKGIKFGGAVDGLSPFFTICGINKVSMFYNRSQLHVATQIKTKLQFADKFSKISFREIS